MSTEFYNRNWRMPNSWTGTEDNNDKFSNYSMSFDGSSETINLGNDISLTGNCTVSFWFKVPAIPNATPEVMFARYTGSGDTDFFIIGLYLQGVLASNNSNAGGSKTTRVNVTLSPNTWYHCAVTKVSGVVTNIYINGTDRAGSVGSFEWWGAGSTDSGFIGQKANADSLFDGKIDHLSIFDYALSQAQITQLYGSSSTGVGNPMAITNGRKPVAYYPIGDYSAFNGEYLVPNSAVSDYVFDFDNTGGSLNDFITFPNTLQSASDFTISLWVNPSSTPQTYSTAILFGNLPNGENIQIVARMANGFFYVSNGSAAYISQSNAVQVDVWTLITVTYNNSTGVLTAYLNGGENIYTSSSGNTLPTQSFGNLMYVGKGSITSTLFDGLISNVATFNTALPATGTESIESLYNYGTPPDISSYSGLQGFWKLDASATFDGSTWSIPDDSSNSNTGTSSGMTAANLVQSNLNILSPYSRYALNFDGSSEYINFNSSTELDNVPSNPYSFSFWFKSSTAGRVLSEKRVANNFLNAQYTIHLESGYIKWYGGSDGVSAGTQTLFTLIDDKWHHIVCVAESTTVNKIYVDGKLNVTSSANRINSSVVAGSLRIGANFSNAYGFIGSISNYSIWNVALTSAQVTEIYNNGLPSNLNNHSAYSNLVSWWQLGENSSFNTNWTVLDEKGTNNGTSANMAEDDLVNGVGTTANGLSSGMGGADNILGESPFSDGNSLSYGMGVDAKSTDVPS